MMNRDSAQSKRSATGQTSTTAATASKIPPAPLPAPQAKPLQRARDVASRFLGYGSSSRPVSPQGIREDRFSHGSSQFMRSASLGASSATASHKTGLELRTISINESGSHAIIAGKEIFKTVKIEDGRCAEDFNLRTAIRSTPTQASGQPRQVYSIDIADVAWAKGDTGNYVAAATSSGKIIVYDLGHAGLQAAQLHEHFRQVHNVTFNPHRGSLLLSGSQDGTVRLWDIRDVRDVRSQASAIASKRKYSGQSDGVRDVKWSPTEGMDFAFGTDAGEVQRWDLRNLKAPKVRIPAHMSSCNTVDWHPDGKHLVSAGSDNTIRVFDVSSSRPRKAAWEIKAPHPVMFARWRPSCQSIMPQDNGAGVCTQIVAGYDREHPVLHIWDFRRPLLPFRETQLYPSAPTDLLWHSQDLLWTVGREGTFTQTDVQHIPKLIDRYNLQAIDVSPLGELTFVAQSRKQRRVPKPQPAPAPPVQSKISSSPSSSPEPSYLSRSWGDDGLDHSFLKALPGKRQARSASNSRFSAAATSSAYIKQSLSATIKLDDILLNRKSFRPQQAACRGSMPTHNNPTAIAFLAERCQSELPATPSENYEGFIQEVEAAFAKNAEHASSLGLLTTSQTWKIVSFSVTKHLKDRLAWKRKHTTDVPSLALVGKITTSIESLASKLAAQHSKSPSHSPGTMRPLATIAQQLGMPESTSNVPTPLARPSTDGKNPSSGHPPLPDLEQGEQLALPPSLASAYASPPPDEATASTTVQSRRLTINNLADLQQHQTYEEEAERSEMVKRWSTKSKNALNLDPVDLNGVKIPTSMLEYHGSGESFQFLEDSTGSEGPSFPASFDSTRSGHPLLVAERPSRGLRPDIVSDPTSPDELPNNDQPMFFNGSGTLSAADTKQNSGNTSTETSTEDLKHNKTDRADFAFHGKEDLEVQQRRSAALKASVPIITGLRDKSQHLAKPTMLGPDQQYNHISYRAIQSIVSHNLPSPTDDDYDAADIELEDDNIFTLLEMLKQLIDYYTTKQLYPQMASLLLLLLGPLLPRTYQLPVPEIHQTVSIYIDYFINSLGWDAGEIPSLIQECFEHPMKAGLQPLQIESILSTYHEQLLRYQLFNEAAVLRKLCYPAYPAVYKDFIKESGVYLMCGQCKKPMDAAVNLRCQSCRQKQDNCPICWMDASPFEHGGSKLFAACLLCGHSGHAACVEEWFVSSKGDGCPTAGCLCACVDGPWRKEKEKEAAVAEQETRDKEHRRVRSDEWKAKESVAVTGARNALSK